MFFQFNLESPPIGSRMPFKPTAVDFNTCIWHMGQPIFS